MADPPLRSEPLIIPKSGVGVLRFNEYLENLQNEVDSSVKITNNGYPEAEPFTVTKLPPLGNGGGYIFVTDEVGGPVLAWSDATNWRRVSDGAIVS